MAVLAGVEIALGVIAGLTGDRTAERKFQDGITSWNDWPKHLRMDVAGRAFVWVGGNRLPGRTPGPATAEDAN